MDMNGMKRNKWGWYDIDFSKMNQKVLHTQEKIVLAYEGEDFNRVEQLKKNLITSWAGVCVAVQTVTTNEHRDIAGVDGMTWSKKSDKEKAVVLLKKLAEHPEMYRASPVRRVEISKVDDGNTQVLEIPTMLDRAYQTLWKLALEPVAECKADERSYGGRPFRRLQDSLTYLWLILVPRKFEDGQLFTWVLDANIKGFYKSISHDWLLDNIPINKIVLRKWLKSGTKVTINGRPTILETNAGIPQGGPLSPLMVNYALDGLQEEVKRLTDEIEYRRLSDELRIDGIRKSKGKTHVKTYFVRYLDDFRVVCKSKKAIINIILPQVKDFLALRGLSLRCDKTRVISTKEGINYLGFSIRMEKHRGSRHGVFLKIKPSKESVKKFRAKVKRIVRRSVNQGRLIQELNGVLREWGNFYKGVHSKRTFSSLDYYITQVLIKWSLKKYRGRISGGKETIYRKTFRKIGGVKWRFASTTATGEIKSVLIQLSKIPIKRHFIRRDGLNPFKHEHREILKRSVVRSAREKEINHRLQAVAKKTGFLCRVCGELLDVGNKAEILHIHHIVPKSKGGSDDKKNLLVLHDYCHMQVTHTKDKTLIARFKEQGITALKESGKH
jgi:RNA-directed DNA polymerase